MIKFLLVGAGGFIGSVLRYWLSGLVQQSARDTLFPIGTLTVNVLGCLVIGILAELGETRGIISAETRLFAMTGILGGFTTFSTFSNESFGLLRDGQNWAAGLNLILSLALGLGAVWLGRTLVHLR